MLAGSPLSSKEANSKRYIPGISCPKCFENISDEKKKDLRKK